jgi:hypothetical protein
MKPTIETFEFGIDVPSNKICFQTFSVCGQSIRSGIWLRITTNRIVAVTLSASIELLRHF